MRRTIFFICIVLCISLLSGCFRPAPVPVPETTVPVITEESTQAQTESPTEETEEPSAATVPVTVPVTEAATEPVTECLHSDFYLPDVSVEDVILYFNEVCLDAEFENSGDATLVQKWAVPIRCNLHGNYTEEDMQKLLSFFSWLNTIEGFPGIALAEEQVAGNLQIHFCSQEELIDILGDQFGGVDGGVTYWYDNNEIYDATICYRTDLDQYLRNSVILEEIYNGLGPVQDTALRADSIIFTEFSQPQDLTAVDELILRLLYHPDIKCGMNALECEAVIRQLYY